LITSEQQKVLAKISIKEDRCVFVEKRSCFSLTKNINIAILSKRISNKKRTKNIRQKEARERNQK
jgi:hypothetical protein